MGCHSLFTLFRLRETLELRELASVCILIGRDLFAIPISYMDIVLVVLEPPGAETNCSLNGVKRNLVAGKFVTKLQ